jgi:hypothetical protein
MWERDDSEFVKLWDWTIAAVVIVTLVYAVVRIIQEVL